MAKIKYMEEKNVSSQSFNPDAVNFSRFEFLVNDYCVSGDLNIRNIEVCCVAFLQAPCKKWEILVTA